MDKIRSAVDGATGMAGRALTKRLETIPRYEVVFLIGHGSAGRLYGEVYEEREQKNREHYGPVWVPSECPTRFKDFVVESYNPDSISKEVDVVFTLLPREVAEIREEVYANKGLIVVSNASANRMKKLIPLSCTEVNHPDLNLVKKQKYKGCIMTNPNCSATVLALPLKPVDDEFRIKEVDVVTFQALSGKGDVKPNDKYYANGAMIGTVLTEIPGEEKKIKEEIPKIMHWNDWGKREVRITAKCNRVYVQHGHMERIKIKTEKPAPIDLVKEKMLNFDPLKDFKKLLPSAPDKPIVYRDVPNTKIHVNAGDGMSVTVGRFEQISEREFDFMGVGHNLIRGAGVQSLLNEQMARLYL